MISTLGLALLTTLTPAPEDPSPLEARATALAEQLLASEIYPGFVIGVVTEEGAWTQGFGVLTPGAKGGPDGDTIFEIGSVTKVFTGLLLADAVARGEAQLDDPLSAHLPEGWAVPKHESREIRLVDLATHTSGLPRMPWGMPFKIPGQPYADYTPAGLREGIARIATRSLATAPGEGYAYSNLGAGLLGVLLGGNGDEWEARLIERLLAPMGLVDTHRTLDEERAARFAPAHRPGGVPSSPWGFDALAGCGALRSTARDLVRFLEIELAGAPEGASDELHAALELAREEHWRAPAGPLAMGLGWHLNRSAHTRWHNGETGGYHAYLAVVAGKHAGVVVLANAASGEADQLGERLLALAAGAPSVADLELRRCVRLPREQLEARTGTYALTDAGELVISVEAYGLGATLRDEPTFRVFPASETSWFGRDVEAELSFTLGDDGRATACTLAQYGRTFAGKRQE